MTSAAAARRGMARCAAAAALFGAPTPLASRLADHTTAPVLAGHSHRHRHAPIRHAHPHVPDLHHRHIHAD